VRTHQARLGGSTRSSSCVSNPNVAHASLRGKQMPAKRTYSGVALNERGPSFRNPTPTMRKNSCKRITWKEAGRACRSTVRRASAPLGASADQDVTVHVHAIRPIHQPISRCLPRARTQCPRKMLPLATRDGQGRRVRVFLFSGQTRIVTSLDEDLWARGGARSSFAAEIVLWTIRGTPHSHLTLKCE
jgi:hypothetical protein